MYKKRKSKKYKLLALATTLAIVAQAIYPIIPFLPSFKLFGRNVIFANDNILATGDTEKVMFVNENPEFKVEFGNKEQADKPFVRFQALGSKENPFAKNKNAEIKETFFERLENAIYGEKEHGIEFSMESAETDLSNQLSVGSLPAGEAGGQSAEDSSTPPAEDSHLPSTEGRKSTEGVDMNNANSVGSGLRPEPENSSDSGFKSSDLNQQSGVNNNNNGNGNKNKNENKNTNTNNNSNDNSNDNVNSASDNTNINDNNSDNNNDNKLQKASLGSGNSIGTLVSNGNEVSPASVPEDKPEEQPEQGASTDQSALELEAELQAEEEIYKILNDQLDALISGKEIDPANKIGNTTEEIEKYRQELKQKILAQLTKQEKTETSTQVAKIEDPEDKTRQKDIIKNKEVVSGVDVDYRIIEEKGLKEEIVIKNLEGFKKECMEKMIQEANNVVIPSESEGRTEESLSNSNTNSKRDPSTTLGMTNRSGDESTNCSLPKNVYSFSLNLDPGVIMHHAIGTTNQKPHGITYFTDEKGKYLFHFLPLYAEDARGMKTNAVRLEITPAESSKLQAEGNTSLQHTASSIERFYTMKVVVDLGWLLDPERQYPVRIDPSIVHDTEAEFDAGNALNRVESLSDPKVDIKPTGEFGNGADGACTVSSGTTNINTGSCAGRGTADAVNFSVTANTSSGQNQITTSTTPTGLSAGDEILVINLMGTSSNYSTVGRYETKRIVSIATNTLTLNGNLKYGYDGTTQKIMVQRVPNYTSVTISSGATLTADAWNGTKNGVVFFRATGTVTNSGTIDMASKGFRGGGNDTSGPEGYSGRSATGGGTGGTGGTGSRVDSDGCGGYVCGVQATNGGNGTNNSGGGGGGGDDGTYCTQGSGGSGGSRGGGGGGGQLAGGGGSSNGTTSAGSGGTSQSGGGGGGGASYSALTNSSDLSSDKIMLGGGAAAGAAGGSAGSLGPQGAGGTGGAPYSANTGNLGGGIVYVSGAKVNLSGTVSANGGNGGAGTAGAAGNGGRGSGGGGSGGNGGSGGTILIRGVLVSLGTVTSSGGSGGAAGSGGNGDDYGGDGGAGSAGSTGSSGVTGIYYQNSVSGTTTPTPSVSKQIDFGYKYGDYTSSVLDLTSGVSSIDSLQWTEHGVATGDGETEYDSTNLVAEWDFNEASGTTAANNAGAGTCGGTATDCDFTLANFASTGSRDAAPMSGWTADNLRWGAGAIMLSGTATADSLSRADIAGNVLDPNSLDMALSAWIKTNDTSAEIFSNNNANGTSCTNDGYYLGIDSSGYPVFNLDTNGATAGCDASITGIAKINDGVYHHLVATVTRGTGAYIYLDGTLIGSDTSVTSYSDITVTGTIYSGGSSGGLDGVLDAMKFYSRALGVNEVLSETQSGNIEFQTRTGADNSPDDGSWEAWKPTTSESQLASMDSDASNWSWDSTATYMPQLKSDESNIKVEGSGSMKQIIGAPQDVDANVVGLWHMDETGGTGAYIKDASGSNYHGTPTGTSLTDGIYNKARSFNGSSDYIGVGTFTPSTNISYEAWVKWSSLPASGSGEVQVIYGHRESGSYNMDTLYLGDNSGNMRLTYAVNNNGSIYRYWRADYLFMADSWYHVAVTQSGGPTATPNLYVNGIAQSVYIDYSSGTPTRTSAPASIGRDGDYDDAYLSGVIDEVRISNVARSAEEIYEAYRMGRDHRISKTISSADLSSKTKLPFWVAGDRVGTYLEATVGESAYANDETDANTVGLYHLEEQSGSGAYIKDSSSSANHGTPTGTTFTDGKIGKARSFNGTSSDYITISGLTWTPTAFSVEFWLYPKTCVNWNQQIHGTNGWGTFYFHTTSNCEVYVGTAEVNRFTPTDLPAGTVELNTWQHFAYTYNGVQGRFYKNGVLLAGPKTQTTPNAWGGFVVGINSGYTINGYVDEIKISNIARSTTEIRQVYEIGRRTHPITIDFQAKLDSGNLIADTSDLSFTVDARPYISTANYGENLYIGDKVIVKENYDGTEYIAQGTVTAITASSGATTVAAWDTGSTVPSGGFTANASVFKWQREWMDVTGPLSSQIDAVTNLTLRCIDGSEGRTVYLDDFKSGGEYLSTSPETSDITSSVQRYMQYRAIFSTTDPAVNPYLSGVTVNYTEGPTTDQLMRHGRWFSSNVIQPFWWAR